MRKVERAWDWAVSGYQLTDKSTEEICALCRAAGLGGIEGVPPLFDGYSHSELESTARIYREHGVTIDTFHLPFSQNDDIASFYETRRRQACQHVRTWMERAACLGVKYVIQHPTVSGYSIEVEGLDRYLAALGRSLDELLLVASDLGLVIAVENMLPGQGGRFGSSPAHFGEITARFDHPNLGFCLDIGHALVAERDSFAAFFGFPISAYHLQDNAGDRDSHLAPGRGLVDWNVVFGSMIKAGYAGTACIEAPPFAFGPDYSLESWKQLVTDTDELVEKARASLKKSS